LPDLDLASLGECQFFGAQICGNKLHESLLKAAQLRSGVGEFRSNTIDLLRYGLDVTVEASQTVVDESEVCGLDYPFCGTHIIP
jgi:hypothetical protein